MTELAAVNRMLSWINEQAVTALDGSVAPATRANTMLDSHSSRIQSRGLTCNSRKNVTYTADGSGYYDVGTALRADPTDKGKCYVQRGTRIYDPEDGTDVFTVGATIKLDIVELLDWTDLPVAAQEYILGSAIREFIISETGDKDMYGAATAEYRAAELEFVRYETKVSDANMINDSHTVAAVAHRLWNP